VKRAALFLLLVPPLALAALWLWVQTAPLGAIERGGSGPPSLVLLHGYGSRAEDWLQFEEHWRLPSNMRRVFPQAPLRGPWSGQRGWWWLHLEKYLPGGEAMPDMSQASPGGIRVAARLVRQLLSEYEGPLVLGGFSQGAMTSAEIAFQSDQELAGLILLGGTTVHEEKWAERFAGRRHLPIFIAHGRNDRVLPFAIMERFQQRLKAFGMDVTWYPFDGGHAMPKVVIDEASAFVRRVVSGGRPLSLGNQQRDRQEAQRVGDDQAAPSTELLAGQ
jgi:phospholipase/carboxylesterase